MADITDEEHLENPTNNQSENASDEITPTAHMEAINPNQETENMEVHHHAHHEGKKSWKSYFWEFLMLFLAVFCGFLAEYQLEHKIENDRGKQYTYSFYEDLVTDSSNFNNLINKYQIKLSALESMSPCYDSLLSEHPSTNCLNTLYSNSIYFPDLIYTDRTLMQLKNAGGLRLLKKADADSILLYDNLLRVYKIGETTGLQEVQSALRETISSLRNYEVWKDTTIKPRVFAIYGNNKELLNKFFNQLYQYSGLCTAIMKDLQKLKKRNAELIEYFKVKYHYH